jgi:AcrR family transcriptional regulator
MTTFDPETIETKFALADAATDLYMENEGDFRIKDIAQAADIEPGEVFDYFPNKDAVLQFYYASIIFRYRLMLDEIDAFDSYTLSEKFSNFAYTSFDMLAEKRSFVEATFGRLILRSYAKTDFEKEIEQLIEQFLDEDPRLSASSEMVKNDYFYTFLRMKYLGLVRFWISDESEGHELTMELTDKLTNFLQELMYNSIADQGFELGKFLYSNKKAFLNNIPVVKQIFSTIEIR